MRDNILQSQIEKAIRNHIADLKLDQYSKANEIHNVIRWIMRDNPDIFWFAHQYHFDETSSTIHFQYTFSAGRVKTIQQGIIDVIDNDFCLEYVKTLTRQEQIAYVYKWLVTYCNYNANSAYNQSVYSVFIRRNSVCTGYAKAAQYLFNLLGIESRLVFGRLHNDKENGRHCWNIVKADNQYYHFDACLGDCALNCVVLKSGIQELFKVNGIIYNFLCVSTEEILKTRSIEDIATLPECSSSWSSNWNKLSAEVEIKQREDIKGCLLSHIGSSADIYLCSKDKNTVLKVFRSNSKTTCLQEFHFMEQTKGAQHLLQCNELFTNIPRNIIAIEQSTPIVDLLCSHYYELSLKGLIKMATDVAIAWKECQERGVLYRDIHVCNIYRSSEGTFKLGDFGSCTNDFDLKEIVGNQWFMAPETFELGIFTEASSVYSISMVMYFILNNLRPAFWVSGCEDEALRKRMKGCDLPTPAGCINLPSRIKKELDKFFRHVSASSPKGRICSIKEFIYELEKLTYYCGNEDYIIHRKGISLEFDIDAGNADGLDACWNYDRFATSNEVNKDCISTICDATKADDTNTVSNIKSVVNEEYIVDLNADELVYDHHLSVDNIESFACTMACPPEDSFIDSSFYGNHEMDSEQNDVSSWMNGFVIGDVNNGKLSYEPKCIPDNHLGKIINYSITELKHKISEEKEQVNEKINSIRIKINEENKIIEGLEDKVKSKGSIIGALIGDFVGFIWEKKNRFEANEQIAIHQEKINKLDSMLILLKEQSDEKIKVLRNQLEEYIALEKEANNVSDVYSSIFAPAEIKRKSHLQVQVYLHLYKETELVKSLANESDKNAERRDYIPLSLKLRKGDRIDIELNIYGETRLISERKSVIWQGSFTKCSFDYFIPTNIDVDELSCEANLFVNGAMIGEMRFITHIVDAPRNLNPEILSHRFNRIFISYAHQDATQVKFLALAYKAQGVDYFYDRDSLAPGDVYEEKIFDYIDQSDLFVLCWSKNAAVSDYVAKEKGRALLRAYPQCSLRDATLKICPISIEPKADLPSDMKGIYNFEEM